MSHSKVNTGNNSSPIKQTQLQDGTAQYAMSVEPKRVGAASPTNMYSIACICILNVGNACTSNTKFIHYSYLYVGIQQSRLSIYDY